MSENLIFISYRRADSAPFALALKLALLGQLRAVQVFLDTHEIQAADRWASQIETALLAAKVVLPVIGHRWDGREPDGSRRIDDTTDWVRREVEIALVSKPGAVLPLLVDGISSPDPSSLPQEIKALAEIQALRIDLNAWEGCVHTLSEVLRDRYGFQPKESGYRFPRPNPIVARTLPIPWEELNDLVRGHLQNWSIEFSDDETRLHHKRIEITRSFEFSSFNAAISFMNTIAQHAATVNHHPRMVNIWRTLIVGLTTWDAGHRVTALDIQFARLLDRSFNTLTSK